MVWSRGRRGPTPEEVDAALARQRAAPATPSRQPAPAPPKPEREEWDPLHNLPRSVVDRG
jgi:hypothetical protein